MGNIWNKLKSIKTAILFFILISLTSLVGTFILQDTNSEQLKETYGAFYGLFNLIGLFDLYNSWWFIGLLAVFCLSIAACSLDRFSSIYKQVVTPPVDLSDEYLKNLKYYHEFKIQPDLKETEASVGKLLEKGGFSKMTGKDATLFHKGILSRWGVLIAHVSVLFVLVGALLGYFFGFKGHLNLKEGQSVSIVNSDKKNISIPLGFDIKLNKFQVEFYKNNPETPKTFLSRVEITDGAVKSPGTIEVNHPINYKGISFYQASYGQDEESARFNLSVQNLQGKEIAKIKAGLNEQVPLPGTGYFVKPVLFYPDFKLDENMKPFSASAESNNPAVCLKLIKAKEKDIEFWVFLGMAEFHSKKKTPFLFKCLDYEQSNYSVLQVVKDPGVPFVYTGFALLILGLALSLFMYYRRIWVKVSGDKIIIAGMANRDPVTFIVIELDVAGFVLVHDKFDVRIHFILSLLFGI